MNEATVFLPYVVRILSNSFKERETFNIADRSSNFRNHDVDVVQRQSTNTIFNLISDMRNYLNGLSKINAASFLIDDALVNLTRCPVAIP